MPLKLPTGWVKTNLGEACLPIVKIQPEDSPDSEFTYFDIGGIDNQKFRVVETKTIIGRNAPSRARQALQRNDILFSTVRTYLRKIARLEHDYPNPVASTGFAVIRAAEGVSSQFLFFQVLSEDFLQPLHSLQTGTSYPAVRARDVFAQPIRLPPTCEQERIVTKLSAALTRLERAQNAAQKAKERLKRYHAAVLQSAVTGEITRDWRETHKFGETGTQLLQRLIKRRRERWEEAELERLRKGGSPSKAGKLKLRYSEPTGVDTTALPKLPRGWIWVSIEQIAAHEPRSITDGPFGSNLKSIHYTDFGPRVIRLQNIGDGVFIDEKAHISQKHYESLKEYAVYGGDLVIRALGIPAPRACKIPHDLGPAIVKADCIRLKVASEFVATDYVLLCLNSPPTQHRTERMVHGIGRPRLNLAEIKSIAIPLPPVEEQSKLIHEVERRLSAASRMDNTLNSQLERAHATYQSLLSEAFAGHLVSQDPNDEPASVLLKRIRAVREAEATKPKGKRMSKSKLKATRRPLLDVLREHKNPMTPEMLFRDSGFEAMFNESEEPQDVVDAFYKELRNLTDKPAKVSEQKNSQHEVMLKVLP